MGCVIIDARGVGPGLSGIGRYTLNLLRGLTRLAAEGAPGGLPEGWEFEVWVRPGVGAWEGWPAELGQVSGAGTTAGATRRGGAYQTLRSQSLPQRRLRGCGSVWRR